MGLAGTLRTMFNEGKAKSLEDVRRELKASIGLDFEELSLVLVMKKSGEEAKFLTLDWVTLMSPKIKK